MGNRKRQRDDNIHPQSSENIERSEEQNVGKGNDIISSLPEDVLHHILSFLSTKDAVRTSVLSRKWEYMWTSISNIDLSDYEEDTSFLDFVERVVLVHDASDIKILRLHLPDYVNCCRLKSWISASIRHNIQELVLDLDLKTQPVLPCYLFTCQSLVVLKLSVESALEVPSLIQFSNLKTLELSYLTFSDDNSTQHLFSSCPVLQELALVNCGWKNLKTITICIPTLKRLTIFNDREHEDLFSCVIKIYAANLIHLHCISCCLMFDFRLYDLSSLVDASICLYEDMLEQVGTPRVLGLFTGIFNVKKLSITRFTLEYLMLVENLLDRLPTFYNMTHLVVDSEFYGPSSGVLMDLIEKSPKLESLTFEQGFERFEEADWMLARVPSCFTSSLKTVHIELFQEALPEMQFIRFLLEYATVLERLTLRSFSGDMKQKQQKVSSQLNKLPRGSKDCVIELEIAKYPAKVPKKLARRWNTGIDGSNYYPSESDE